MSLKVISEKNMPARFPFGFTALSLVLLDRWNASDILSGIVYTLLFFLWALFILIKWKSEPIDIFKDDN